MKCEDVQRVLPELMDGAEDRELRAHLDTCPECSELVSDLDAITGTAKVMAASDEPPARVWVNIANQLRAEGIIREQEQFPARPAFVPARPRRSFAWWLAPVAAGIIAVGAYQLGHKSAIVPNQQVAQQTGAQATQSQQQAVPSQPAPQQQVAQSSAPSKPTVKPQREERAANQPIAEPPASYAGGLQPNELSLPDDDRVFEQSSPAMRAAYEKQLQAVNAEIRETLDYIKKHPRDLDARQHLMDIYQQKAMLYQMALDRVQ